MIQINHRDPRPIYEQVKESLCKLVITGAVKPDEKLPSVRDLATMLAINPNTIQRAYRELESEGYIYTIPGKGSFAAPIDQVNDAYRQKLYEEFDSAAAGLLSLGESPSQLQDRIQKLLAEEKQNP